MFLFLLHFWIQATPLRWSQLPSSQHGFFSLFLFQEIASLPNGAWIIISILSRIIIKFMLGTYALHLYIIYLRIHLCMMMINEKKPHLLFV